MLENNRLTGKIDPVMFYYIKDKNGDIIGAVGVSGGLVPQDIEVADAGAKAIS